MTRCVVGLEINEEGVKGWFRRADALGVAAPRDQVRPCMGIESTDLFQGHRASTGVMSSRCGHVQRRRADTSLFVATR